MAEPEPDRTEVFWLVPEPDRTFLVGSGHIFRKMIYTQPAPAKTMVPILNKIQNNLTPREIASVSANLTDLKTKKKK